MKKRHIENIKTNYTKPKAEVSRDAPKANDKLPTINDVLPTANDDSSATNDALPMTVDNSSTTSNESTITTDATDTTDTTDESPKTYNTASENEVKHICPKCGSELVLRTANKGKMQGNAFGAVPVFLNQIYPGYRLDFPPLSAKKLPHRRQLFYTIIPVGRFPIRA